MLNCTFNTNKLIICNRVLIINLPPLKLGDVFGEICPFQGNCVSDGVFVAICDEDAFVRSELRRK